MSTKTLFGMATTIQKNLGASESVAIGEIYDALYDANRWVHGVYDWPWVQGEFKVDLKGTYSTGTVTLTNGVQAVTGTNTVWNTNWVSKRLFCGSKNMDYVISSFFSPTTLLLTQSPNIGATLTDVGYTIFQDTYDLPADYEPGQDIALFNPLLKMQVRKLPRESLEQQSNVLKPMFSTTVWGYCDAGFNPTTKRYQIKVIPAPASDFELRFWYRKAPLDLIVATDTTQVPETFCQIVEAKAEAEVRETHRIPGAVAAEAKANQLLRAMKRRLDRQPITNRPSDHGTGGPPDSSASWNGLSMLPGWNA